MGWKQADVAIIGGGIVGLSTAMQTLRRRPGLRVVVLEKEARVAAHQTGRNSGVIHAGLYYKPGSLKAELCVRGAREMVAFCREHGLPHDVCGKVVVATSDAELPALHELKRRADANRVPGVALIGPERLRELEPQCSGVAALHVPTTGITDFAAVARKYAEFVAAGGGEVITGAGVIRIHTRAGEQILETERGEVAAQLAVNCAGLHSDRIARLAGAEPGVRIVPFRGEYYELAPAAQPLVRALIYPVPDPRFPFLGVHFTRRIAGGVEAGPNAVLAWKREGYRKLDVSPRDLLDAFGFAGFWRMAGRQWRSALAEYHRSFSKAAFVHALQRLVPAIRSADLKPAGAGVRAQALDATGALVDDFRFVTGAGFIHVLNVPSPAATASLPVGAKIVDLREQLLPPARR